MLSPLYHGICVFVICLLVGCRTVNAEYVCPEGWILNENNCYYFSTDMVTWDSADAACQAKGSQLAEIHDESENAFLLDMAQNRSDSFFWIGLSDILEDGSFTWNSGNALTYTNWTGAGPYNDNLEDCVYLYRHTNEWGWEDNSCFFTSFYICEQDLKRNNFWIGLTDQSSDGNFVWNSDNTLAFTDFITEIPENSHDNECVNIFWQNSSFGWMEDSCDTTNYYICESIAQESDACTDGTNNCDVNAVCTITGSNFVCTCSDGFTGVGTECTDINECADGTNGCSHEAKCENTEGSYTCTCKWGFIGDGTSCSPQVLYRCNPDDSLDLYNLPEDSHIFSVQNIPDGDGNRKCNVIDVNATSVTITGCSKDLPIVTSYGTFDGMARYFIQGGSSLVVVSVRCLEIADEGRVHTVGSSYSANLVVDDKVVVNPAYEVTSTLSATSTTVGSPVGWTITFPEEYLLEVSSCTAYPGTDDTSSFNLDLVTNGGCPVSPQLSTEFTSTSPGIYSAVIYAFKFYGYNYVYLTCTLKVCPQATSACTTECDSRKKRHIEKRASREPRGTFPATITNVLRVTDSYGSGVTGLSHTRSLAVFFLIILLV